jgi:hypothetical protein
MDAMDVMDGHGQTQTFTDGRDKRKFKGKNLKCKIVEALRGDNQFHSRGRLCHVTLLITVR